MPEIQQNTLYLATPGSYIHRDHLTLQVEVPEFPPDLPLDERSRETATGKRKLSIPIHHLESICVFGLSTISPHALSLCWDHGVAVHFLSENGYLHGRLTGVADTSVLLRRTQFRAADDPVACVAIGRQIVAGKIQNSRNSLLRAARETASESEREQIEMVTDALGRQLRDLAQLRRGESLPGSSPPATTREAMDKVRGIEGMASQFYFSVFSLMLKQQRNAFAFTVRSRRPPRDRMNCLLSFLYALVRHDCVAALTCAGLDPFVGFLHTDRPNRPSLALDLMEEFRPWVADRLAVTLINRQQIGPQHFNEREGGGVEFTEAGRKLTIQSYQQRKQERLQHVLLDQTLRIGQLYFVQARILARTLRKDLPAYVPFVPK